MFNSVLIKLAYVKTYKQNSPAQKLTYLCHRRHKINQTKKKKMSYANIRKLLNCQVKYDLI